MASRTYSLRALVLRRTKLGETDVICTLLTEGGEQVRAVAKGARKPSSPFSSRLEVYAVCDLLLSSGRSLDIVKEARLVSSNDHLRVDYVLMDAAAPLVELLDRTTQAGLEDRRLFPMTCKALSLLKGADPRQAVSLCAAHLLKTSAILGFRPRLDSCVECGRALPLSGEGGPVGFSLVDGGRVCASCARSVETIRFDSAVIGWAHALLFSSLDECKAFAIDDDTALSLFRFIQMWLFQHLGVKLKSLSFLLSQS